MGGGVTIKLEGIGNVEQAFAELADEIGDKKATSKVLVPAAREAMQPVLRQAQSLAPVDTGALFLSLQVEARRPTKRDRRSKYITETDTVIATVTTASGKKLKQMSEGKGLIRSKRKLAKMYGEKVANEFTGIPSDARAMAQEFGTAHNPAKSYLRPAIESQAQTTVNRLSEILARRIAQFKAKMK
ncbi:Bacteriophage HK97-gp10, putative tail-component [uncultured Caudovirales phage]|uniref:Bacteriophage HK97-gp10, putative tail-component n=1 Tax=uncultured Caudovirales phage TaxID=2100421 RepID=A0A6J7WC75_9CAUD|nr:Bacteriophage HK97-gp10, putative tail-component [uncultured Caudovirales phage]